MAVTREAGDSQLEKLPPELQAVIRKKCSRDPTTRFTHKIELLLAFVVTNAHLENDIGLSWVSKREFRINKKRLVGLLGIKMNSMNVNLRDLGFHKVQHEKNGWTRWTRDGLTKGRVLPDAGAPPRCAAQGKARRVSIIAIPFTGRHLTLGCVRQASCDRFVKSVRELWSGVFGADLTQLVATDTFVARLAAVVKQPEQPLSNAIAVLGAILAHEGEGALGLAHLIEFLARFGPHPTAMLKIASLLACADGCQDWLFFSAPRPAEVAALRVHGAFCRDEPNCFVLSVGGAACVSVWNVPLVDAVGCYLIDERKRTYPTWVAFFDTYARVP